MQKDRFVSANMPGQLAAIKQNDEATLKALYTENYVKIEAYVLNNNGSTEEAKDIFQEAFIAVWRNIQLDKFTPHQQTSLSGYLYQVAKNKWIDHLRSGQYKKLVPLHASENGFVMPEDLNNSEQDYLKALKINFEKLGENCRVLLKRFYYQKESLKSIAANFGWTEATAKNNKYRCLQRLRELIKNH